MHKLIECDPLCVQKTRANRICQIYLAMVQTTQHKDSSVSSVALGSFSKILCQILVL